MRVFLSVNPDQLLIHLKLVLRASLVSVEWVVFINLVLTVEESKASAAVPISIVVVSCDSGYLPKFF